MYHYYLEELINDNGLKWQNLLGDILKLADSVEFVIPGLTAWCPKTLKPLLPFAKERFTSRWRWQQKQGTKSVFIRFNLLPEVTSYIFTAPRLTDWLFNRPEDPALYQGDKALLWTISHEGFAFIHLNEELSDKYRQKGFLLDVKMADTPPTIKDI